MCCDKHVEQQVYSLEELQEIEKYEELEKGFRLQSGVNSIDSVNVDSSTNEEIELTTFHDNVPGTKIAMPVTDIANTQVSNKNVELDKYLRRPVVIRSYTLTQAGIFDESFNPWFLYLNHPSIKKKIDNYYLFRGKLKLKVVINAAPFYYGAYILSYQPLAGFFNPAPITSSNNSLIPLSQRPHIYIYPQNNQGGEMILPFLYHEDYLDLSSASAVQNMGTCTMRNVYALDNANGVLGGSCNVTIYASLDDYDLSGPTSGLVLQSGNDEYGEGIVSKPASAIARAAGHFENIPIIGKFATATKVGASAVSSIASLFGFTDVPDLSQVESFTPAPFPRQATVDISTGIEKLTIDSKNELTIDSSVSGVDLGDELMISNIAGKESYLTQFAWTAAQIPNDLLFNIAVSPNLLAQATSTQQLTIHGTPMWMVSRMFNYWRGDIYIRFRIICSQFHRGRLRINWDPDGPISSTNDATTETYTKIIDISECNDITIRVPYMQEVAYSQCSLLTDARYGTSPITYTPRFENGVLTVRVLNEQTSPSLSSDIRVLVSVFGADNLEFANPRELDPDYRFSPFTVQSGTISYENEDEEETNIALVPSQPSKEINLIYQGEHIVSLRQLLRRFQFSRSIMFPTLTNTDLWTCVRHIVSRRPLYPGFDTNGVYRAVGLVGPIDNRNYNWCRYTYLNWISQCFVAERGSINLRLNYVGPEDCTSLRVFRQTQWSVLPLTRANYANQSNTTNVNGRNNIARNTAVSFINEAGGVSMTNTKTNAGLTVSLPMYSIFKFLNTNPLNRTLGIEADLTNTDATVIDTQFFPRYLNAKNANYQDTMKIDSYYSAGTDYNCLFFLNVPTIYRYLTTPSSSEV